MIKPKKLVVENFMSIGSAQVDLADQGLVSIKGVNKDDPTALSNGAGKSSIVDAISWCLFGATARGVTGDSVVNIQAGKGTCVELEVEIDGDTYHIMRGRKHRALRNRVQVRRGVHDLTMGTDKQTQTRINNLLGCTLEVFNAAIYMGQENMPDLPAMTDKQLKSVLEEVLSLNKLDLAMDEVNSRVRDIDIDIQSHDAAIHSLDREVWDAESKVRFNVSTLGNVLEWQRTISEELVERKRHYTNQVKVDKKKIANLEARLSSLTITSGADNAKELADLDAEQKVVDSLRHQSYEDQAIWRQRVVALGDLNMVKGDCKCCGKPLNEHPDHVKALKELQDAMPALTAQAEKSVKAHKQAQQQHQARRDEVKARHTKESADSYHAVTIKQEIKDLKALLKRFVVDWHMKQESLENNLKRHQATEVDLRAQIDAAKHDVTWNMGRIDGHRLDKDYLEEALTALGKVKHALGRKGFRGEILDEVTPYLNARTEHYLTALTDGMITASWSTIAENSDGDYVENFHIDIKHQSGIANFNQLSGGEKRKVRLACAMALQDLVATRAVKPIQLFIADEIDNAIDEAGLELLMGVLEEKARVLGSVFMISHNSLDDWARNHLVVTKQDGVSTFAAH